MTRILLSSYRQRSKAPERGGPVRYPRWVNGKVQFQWIDPARIPAGWQSVNAHVPMRLATCEETDCPMYLNGWTEVVQADGNHREHDGAISRDEAASIYGLFGPQAIAPQVVHHPPGTVCPGDRSRQPPVSLVRAGEDLFHPRAHKVPADLPPIYNVDGRTVLWNEFEDSLLGGWDSAVTIATKGI